MLELYHDGNNDFVHNYREENKNFEFFSLNFDGGKVKC